ncbi:hypothetical protein AN640_08460 [Candidatus Epulonipiscium fishelsonii]|uniref:Uncharacterized protein n=1 Tax=Candidatus Epulonipiscium fishelsonii TaxID=77094 RepID=A0ACC8XDC9_9FIRM|nr:hypothetical protein AN640_08460 [Epulopiscium sp. SCG-D08WGA-EpuloA1]OON90410.1 MAG: hypothetical protein ATN32_00495 [Epulopiscium sp. AS2M-Bin002]
MEGGVFLDNFLLILELIGTVSFAVSGGMVAIHKKTDIFGVLLLAAVTAVGGGITRDVILGKTPPTAFINKNYVLIALATAFVLFFIAKTNQKKYQQYEMQIFIINNIFDAIGLGIFTVVGVQVGQQAEQGENLFFCLFLGVVTAIGGGMIRDLMLKEVPFVLEKQVYAVACLLGGASYWYLTKFSALEIDVISVISIIVVFTIRMLATKYEWNLPKAIE